jgi:hypothetical protein
MPFDDGFLIQTEQDHWVPGSINLFGTESQRLTASLAVAGWPASSGGPHSDE